ncbi:MAG: hypothetical protein ACOY3I_02600 [Verrucomicrobiota bacterium]
MKSWDDFQYALENTQVVVPPQKRLETFGTTLLNYHLVTEEMDAVNQSLVREGQIVAEKPQLITPVNISKLLLEGFGEEAEDFAELINQHGQHFAILKYGFSIKKNDIRTYEVREPLIAVVDKIKSNLQEKNDPLAAILTGVDDGWEVCLLKFMFDLVNVSGEGNIDDLRKKGLL